MNHKPFTFALGADTHCEIMHDGEKRLNAFVEAAQVANAAFLVHLGDLCHSQKKDLPFMRCIKKFPREAYMVLGNHDTDVSDKLTMTAFLGMKRPYSSFDYNGFHFCLLDTNTVSLDGVDYDYGMGNYFAYPQQRENISRIQLEWLEKDLEETELPAVLFSHASLYNKEEGICNREAVHALLVKTNAKSGHTKVFASLNGHNHVDSHMEVDGIHYIDINSMSNCWIGEEYAHKTFGTLVEIRHPAIRCTVPYRDSLFTMVQMDAGEKTMVIEGAKTTFVGKGPTALGHSGRMTGFPITPVISRMEVHF